MGTDIHMCVETKVYDADSREDMGWQLVPSPIVDCYSCDGTAIATTWQQDDTGNHVRVPTGEPCRWCTIDPATLPTDDGSGWNERKYEMTRWVGPGKRRDEWFSERNYIVFAVLGNVRNGRGFAGIYSHEPLPYLSDSAGFPDDMADETIEWFARRGGDHSDTWVNLRDVLTYDWNQTVHKSGVLTLGDWAEYRANGLPQSWSGEISGGTVTHVNPSEMDDYLARYRAVHGAEPGRFSAEVDGVMPVTRLQWGHPLGNFASHFLERMRMLAMQVGEAPTRLIFNFDS